MFTPPAKAERLTEKALGLERRGKRAGAAECYRVALHEAEKVVEKDHGYVAVILERYRLALRHAGQHVKSETIKGRAEAMWEKYGQGHLSD